LKTKDLGKSNFCSSPFIAVFSEFALWRSNQKEELHVKNFNGGAAARAIARLRNARDEIELALRPPGERITITRQALESILDDIAVTGVCIRRMAECGRD
jgi:hypothetical protein